MRNEKWLKKYTKLRFLPSLLMSGEIFLGKQDGWPDCNDRYLIDLYCKKMELDFLRIACLTESPDRFHFWDIYGEREKGICLWFDKDKLIKDIGEDNYLFHKKVSYLTPKNLKNIKICDFPFTKRQQYADEREYRIFRKGSNGDNSTMGAKFLKSSLKRIYLNSWLKDAVFKIEKEKLKQCLARNDYNHVKILRNRVTEGKEWKDAADAWPN